MPKIKTLLAKIAGTEGIDADVLAAIQAEGDRLETSAIEAKSNKSTGAKKTAALEKSFSVLATQLGIEGETDQIIGEVTKKALALVSESESLATERDTLATERDTLKTQLEEVQGKVNGFEQKSKVQEFATVGGLVPEVLQKILGDRIDEMQVKDKSLFLGETPIKDAVAADPELSVFEKALFKSEAGKEEEPKGSGLPKGSPKGAPKKEVDPLDAYIAKAYAA